MKKCLGIVMALICTLCFFSVDASAKSYNVDDTDITIAVDSQEWSVITRKNALGNSDLKSMGISPQYFYDAMINTNVYLDMFRIKENSKETIEFKIYKENNTDINNYKNLSDRKLKKTGEYIADKRDADIWEVYSENCNYIYMEYSDFENNYIEYYTVVNNEEYRLVASKTNKFSESEKADIRAIVDSAEYTINSMYANEKGMKQFWSEYGIQTVIVIVILLIVVGAAVVFKKRKKAPKQQPKQLSPKQEKPKKPVDSTMVTIDRQKRKSRKK